MRQDPIRHETSEPMIGTGIRHERDASRPTPETITIDSLYRGPMGMSNGGFTAGTLAKGPEGPMQVRLEHPVPYEEVLTTRRRNTGRELLYGDSVLAIAKPAVDPIAAPPFVEAELVLGHPRWQHGLEFFADCFVCGRPAPDGLGVELRRIDVRTFAAVWQPSACQAVPRGSVADEFLWAALDCPGGYAALASSSRLGLLGSIAVDIQFRPDSNQSLVVVGQATTVEGRKLGAATGIYATDGELVAAGSAVWIALKETM